MYDLSLLYRSISEFKQGNQPRINIGKDEKVDLVVDSHSILAMLRNHFSQILNIHGVNDVRDGFGGLGVACWPLIPGRSRRIFRAKKSSARLPSEGK